MSLCKDRRLSTVAGDNSHVLTPISMHLIPIPIPWLILLPFPWESHGTHGILVFPIPMHTSTRHIVFICRQCARPNSWQPHRPTPAAGVKTTSNHWQYNHYCRLASIVLRIVSVYFRPHRMPTVAADGVVCLSVRGESDPHLIRGMVWYGMVWYSKCRLI